MNTVKTIETCIEKLYEKENVKVLKEIVILCRQKIAQVFDKDIIAKARLNTERDERQRQEKYEIEKPIRDKQRQTAEIAAEAERKRKAVVNETFRENFKRRRGRYPDENENSRN